MLELAVALANGPAQLVIASGSDAVVAARSAVTQKRVVAVSTGAALGVCESLARRAGNFTGIARFSTRPQQSGSRCFPKLLPRPSRLGVVHDSSVTTVQRTASALG
jgi:hypothetical protein